MKTVLERWSISYKELRNGADSLFYLDLCNKTRYKRRKKQEGLLELASREAHEKKPALNLEHITNQQVVT